MLYQDGERITTETSLDLYAVWADAYTVTFDNDGTTATVMTPRNGAIGSRIPADPSREGYTFDGWFNGETKLTAETVISGDSTTPPSGRPSPTPSHSAAVRRAPAPSRASPPPTTGR